MRVGGESLRCCWRALNLLSREVLGRGGFEVAGRDGIGWGRICCLTRGMRCQIRHFNGWEFSDLHTNCGHLHGSCGYSGCIAEEQGEVRQVVHGRRVGKGRLSVVILEIDRIGSAK